MIKMKMFVFTDNTGQNDNQMLAVVCINISTTVVFIGVAIALFKR